MNLELELPGGAVITAEQSIRDPLPPQGPLLLWELAMVRFVEAD
jgi:hypothetical protein